MNQGRRIVITGVGVVSPLGNDVDSYFDNLLNAKSGIGEIQTFDAADYGCRIAGHVKDFDVLNHGVDKKDARRMDTFVRFAIGASDQALKDSGLDMAKQNMERVGVIIGSGIGGLPVIENQYDLLLKKGPGKVNPFLIPMLIINMAPGQVAIRFGLKGPNACIATACASSNHAMGEAANIIQRGDADIMLAGGTEACITKLGVAGFACARALSTRNDDPTRASRPYDLGRDGFVMGEGSGMMVFEEYEAAKARGAHIYAEIIGYGLSDDAYHMTSPPADGEGGYRAMKMAVDKAKLNPEDIEYINAHGTSTPVGDKAETLGIKRLFGDHATSKKLWVSSTKSMTGHLLGAAGGVEAIACLKMMQTGKIHPTANLDEQDPECDLDYVANEARERKVKYMMSNSFGFGGHNASVIFKSMEG